MLETDCPSPLKNENLTTKPVSITRFSAVVSPDKTPPDFGTIRIDAGFELLPSLPDLSRHAACDARRQQGE